jgi:hypothetical protein
MMENDDFLKDDFLGDLIRQSPLDSPSDGFVDRVMENIQTFPAVSAAGKPWLMTIKSSLPYAMVTLVVMLIFATSDLPFFNWLPGKDFFVNNLVPYFGGLFGIFKNAFASKYVSWVLLISFSVSILFTLDRLLSRRTSV